MRTAFIYISFLLLHAYCSNAQTSWASPEIEQIYNQASAYLSQGKLQDAINTYKQAIILAPDHMILHRDLAKAYYLSGDYKNAESTITPVLKTKEADDLSFEIMAGCQSAQGEKKKAKTTIQNGLALFPASGVLYHELGKIYESEDDLPSALNAWLTGIHGDPTYHLNYYEAARMYVIADKPIWVALYGETFVNMERYTPRADEVRTLLISAYSRIFNSINSREVPKYKKGKKPEGTEKGFEVDVRNTLLKLSPVISDGINTENLSMLRIRFLMEWMAKYKTQYPFTLFIYQDNMLRNGYFEIYNEWLFGKADNAQAYEAWKKFHEVAFIKFETWMQNNKLQPVVEDFYNNMEVDIFPKAKKK